MKLELTNKLQKLGIFWKIRRILMFRVDFPIFVFLNKIESGKDHSKKSFYVLIRSIRSMLPVLLLSVIILLIINFPKLFFDHTQGNKDAVSIISTMVTIVGVVLGLYYASLTSTAGNYFMKAPKSLQDVFLSEMEGGQYVKIITLTTVMGLFYMCAAAAGFPVTTLDIVIMATLTIYAAVRILSIGPLPFYFIHPTKVAHESCSNIMGALRKVTYRNFGYKKDYLQKHNRDYVKKQFNILQDLVDFSITKLKVSPTQLVQVATFLEMTCLSYVSLKRLIPIKSLWFDQSYKQKKWLFADESAVSLAIRTGTNIQPEIIANNNWFERTIIDMLIDLMRTFATEREWAYAQQCLEILGDLAEKLGTELDAKNVSYILNNVNLVVIKIADDNRAVQDHNYLAFIDSAGRLYISAALGLRRFAEKYDLDYIAKQFLNISQKRKSLLSVPYPGVMSEELQKISQLLANECRIEGRLITPDWYIQTLSVRLYCNSITNYYDAICKANSEISSLFVALKKDNSLAATILASRISELYAKMVDATKYADKITSACQLYNKIEGLEWLEISGNAKEAANENLEHAIDNVVLMTNSLVGIPKECLQDLPDFIGQAYSYGLDAIYQAAIENDPDRLTKLFNTVMAGALRVRDDAVEEMDDWAEQSKILMSTETFEDLFMLSGFIKIYSELYDNPKLWEPCKASWDKLLDNCKVSESYLLKQFIKASNYRDTQFVLKRSDHVLAAWQSQLAKTVRQKGFDKDLTTSTNAPYGYCTISKHKNPLARLVINKLISYPGIANINARDLFFGVYLSQREAAKGLVFPDRSHIMESLKREADRGGDSEREL